MADGAISAEELIRRIHEECRVRGVTQEQFEDGVAWGWSGCINPPEHLLEDMTVDALQRLCGELRIDWRRVMLSL